MSLRNGVDDWADEEEADEWADDESLADFPDEGHTVRGVVASISDEEVLMDAGLRTLGRIPSSELPADINGKPREALSVGDEIEALVIDSRYGRLPILSVAMLHERIAWSEYSTEASFPTQTSTPEAPDFQNHGERAVSKAIDHQIVDPVEFLQPTRRILVDTNIFLHSAPGALKRLFERGQAAILENSNPIVVPTKVVKELTDQSRRDSTKPGDDAEVIARAGNALVFLDSASGAGLIRKDLGDETNPYADDLFLKLLDRFADKYEMCLLTDDITVKLRVRLLAQERGRRLLDGVVTRDGYVEIDSDQRLYKRGVDKLARHTEAIAKGKGKFKDRSEVKALTKILPEFKDTLRLADPVAIPHRVPNTPASPKNSPTAAQPSAGFAKTTRRKPSDTPLSFSSIPGQGDEVTWTSADRRGSLVLGALLGEGGEGSVYEAANNTVVKIFDKDHLTRHRKEKIELLVGRELRKSGLCIPSAVVRNGDGEFVGYVMPMASGREFQRTIFNKRKFEREFPNWKKTDLVDICISFLEKVQYLHSMNVILGDINPKNLMVDEKKNVFIIDADSWQLEGYPCPVGTPMFTSPAMLGKTYSDDLRTMEDELFAVATMLFMIVMTGQFPYIRTGTDGDMVQLIKEGNFAFQYENRNNKDQPDGDWKYMWSHIHKPVKDLFWHTFHREGKRYKKRPTSTEWLEAFKAYKSYLGNKRMSFDPMSNDVYPIRNKAFKQDTPIQDCPTCGRQHAIAGIWSDDTQEYFVPRQCNKCRDQQPGRAPASRMLTAPCRDCGLSFPKSQLKYGRCPLCAQKDDERRARANTLDPSRLCARCQKAFITYGNVEWHQRNGRTVPTTHKAGYGGTYPSGCVPVPIAATTPRTAVTSATARPTPQPKVGFWTRLSKWFSGD
ncbi:protein kinase domain-containing protein [Microbacterium aurum]